MDKKFRMKYLPIKKKKKKRKRRKIRYQKRMKTCN